MNKFEYVWVFQGNNSNFPSATFSTIEKAIIWITANNLSGILTQYPINISVYDWAINEGYFKPKTENKKTPDFISKFSSAYLTHYHFIDGEQVN